MRDNLVLYEKKLARALLASVSRSFYLSLRILPASVRGILSLAYLLARATDTIADTPGELNLRLEALEALLSSIAGESTLPNSVLNKIISKTSKPTEKQLLISVPQCLQWLNVIDSDSRNEIRRVLDKIGKAQILDLTRFEHSLFGIESDTDLHEYTYLVAGSVGEFWTRIAIRKLDNYADASESQMLTDGCALGCGLQLVNILRDFPNDLKKGRCYLPGLAFENISSNDLLKNLSVARPVFERWWQYADASLDAGLRYAKHVQIWRMRFACLLPIRLGRATLMQLWNRFPEENIKITRTTVRAELWKTLFFSLCATDLLK